MIPADPLAATPGMVGNGMPAGMQTGNVPAERMRINVGLPTERHGSDGQLSFAPNVNLVPDPISTPPTRRTAAVPSSVLNVAGAVSLPTETLPPGGMMPGTTFEGEMLPPMSGPYPTDSSTTPIFSDLVAAPPPQSLSWFQNWRIARNAEAGVGRERLAMAPFAIDTAQPFGNLRFRVNSFNNTPFPDRAEYLWAKTIDGKGPKAAEPNLDYQEFRTQLELGNKKFSTATEFPIRWTNPDVNPNHAGFGDMNLTVKTVFVDGDVWQITQLFRTYFATGAASMGLGTGHFSLEPGALVRYKYSDVTFLHGELKYFFPLGGDPMFSGQVLQYGLGMSHVLIDGDNYAVLPTCELTGSYIGNGLRTNPDGLILEAEGEHLLALTTGLRYVRDCGGDLGLFEYGLSMSLPVSAPRFYDALFRFDLRWSF